MPPPSPSRRSPSRPAKAKLPPRPERRAAELFGHRGELLAALFLQLKFYRIMTRRFKTPVGEIDLVVRRGATTVFVEVKARRRAESEAETLESIDQRRIVRAAEWYIMRHPALAETPLRFDVIFLAPGRWPRHIVNAFDAS